MKWTIGQLRKLPESYSFETVLDFHSEMSNIEDMIDIEQVKVEGTISRIEFDLYLLNATIDANLVLACAKTLEPVDYKLHINLKEWHGTDKSKEDEEDYYFIEGNTLDLEQIVWTAILVNKPIRVVREDADEILAKRGISFEEAYPDDDENNLE